MKNTQSLVLLVCLLASFTLSSCSLIGDIFQAGMSVGIFIVVVLVIVILLVIKRVSRK